MFGNGRYGGNHLEPCPGGLVTQLHQRILVGPVAIDAEQDGPGSVAVHRGQTCRSDGRHPSAVGGHGNQRHLLGAQLHLPEIDLASRQVDLDRLVGQCTAQHCAHTLRPTRRAEADFMNFHTLKSFTSE